MIDSHCHPTEMLNFKPSTITVVATGFSPSSNRKVKTLHERFKLPFAVGIAPQTLKLERVNVEEELAYVEEAGANAIGEIGLDWKWGKEEVERAEQEKVFLLFMAKARELDKPIVVHSRRAEKRVIELVKHQPQVVLHYFSGNNIEEALATDAYFTVPPVRSPVRTKLISNAGIERLLVESDAPYVGKTPESINVSIDYIAEVLEMDREEVKRETTKNAQILFKL